jgi:hypothetical protein
MIPNVKGGGLPSESIQATLSPAVQPAASPKSDQKPAVSPEVFAAEKAAKAKKSSEANTSVVLGSGSSSVSAGLPKAEFSPRLTIEKDEETGGWIYKALDPITGEVINQFPREQLVQMKNSPTYQPGDVIKTQA